MNGLDVFLIILGAVIFIGGSVLTGAAIKDDEIALVPGLIMCMIIFGGLCLLPFIVLDRGSGSTIGEITSVDKNFFGTTAVYIKTSENSQEKYCIENEKVAEETKELIGKRVKITYGERVGLYSTGKCSQAPIEKVEEIEEE